MSSRTPARRSRARNLRRPLRGHRRRISRLHFDEARSGRAEMNSKGLWRVAAAVLSLLVHVAPLAPTGTGERVSFTASTKVRGNAGVGAVPPPPRGQASLLAIWTPHN